MRDKSIEELTAEIKARYGIAGAGAGPKRFPIVLIRPSHYDAEGYVVHWFRSALSSNPLASLESLLRNIPVRQMLGPAVETELRSIDEEARRIRPDRLAREFQGGQGLVILAAVSASQLPRAMDIALPLRVAGVPVCMEGPYISSRVALQGAVTPELQEAMNLGVTLFAGMATQERIDELVRDAWRGGLKPLYNSIERATNAALPPMAATRRLPGAASGPVRLSPFECSFSTVVSIDDDPAGGRRSAEEIERSIRAHLQSGAPGRFLLADRNFSRNREWQLLFDRLIAMREQEKIDIEWTLQIDALCHRIPGFMEKAARAGVRGVFFDLDLDGRKPAQEDQPQDPISACRMMLGEWKRAGMIVFARYAIGGEGKTADAVSGEIRMLQRELPIDVLQPISVTARIDDEWAKACRQAWKEFYTRDHMQKILRRAVATGTDVQNLLAVLLWFHFCVVYEKVQPLWGGSWRRKHRRDRRPSMEKDDPMTFYATDAFERVYKQIRKRLLYERFRSFVKQLQGEPGAKSYTDPALDLAKAPGILLPHLPVTR